MYQIPQPPSDGKSKFQKTDCSSGAPVLDSNMGMGGKIDGLLVCSSCRKPAVVNLIQEEWVHV